MIIFNKTSVTLTLVATLFLLTACTGKKPEQTKHASASSAELSSMNAVIGLEIGDLAPEMALESPDHKTIALSSYRGKLVLIDFWASWCMPCRVENPNLVKLYNTYKDKKFSGGEGFTIFSVSLDKDRESWIRGIEQDGLVWEAHVSDLKGWESAPAALYHVASIPSNLLINDKGVIIAKNLRAESLETTIKNLAD